MSNETLADLNTNTLIGHTDTRGTAWHYRAELQGETSNHYPNEIPVDDVARRLFDWDAQSRPVAVERPADVSTMTHLNEGGRPVRWETVPDRQAIVRSDRSDGNVMGIFTNSYTPHPYREWLLETVANLLDDDLSISSAGLLRDGAIAWVEVSVPRTFTTLEGVQFRPNLLATTTFDGSLATTYKRTVTDVVCDNTRATALGEKSEQIKVRHSKHSRLRLSTAREALNLVFATAEDFTADIRALCSTQVSDRQWADFLDLWAPVSNPAGERMSGKALTLAERKRDAMATMWATDPRVAPWRGTAHGVLQAANTYEHHARPVRGASRAERNMLRTVTGDFAAADHHARELLNRVLA
ncbi:DUF932 domain-containing protein [Demequina sp. B12]|uniref:DUF932 domain-containing protein n=1 Tax=Demequina sp. B12 TaxID=2992757 RepID=UPI00237BF69D|nr:DUF932 domain-containing protein [Demequina sp. B12]MDE0571808.1 DUF932 domain-containing protein [Demequina sp. B12]